MILLWSRHNVTILLWSRHNVTILLWSRHNVMWSRHNVTALLCHNVKVIQKCVLLPDVVEDYPTLFRDSNMPLLASQI